MKFQHLYDFKRDHAMRFHKAGPSYILLPEKRKGNFLWWNGTSVNHPKNFLVTGSHRNDIFR